jgi:hypothetical protein
MAMNRMGATDDKSTWKPGDPVVVPTMEQRFQIITAKVLAERNQLEATAIELDVLVTTYRTAYDQAAVEITRLNAEVERLNALLSAIAEAKPEPKMNVVPMRPTRAEVDEDAYKAQVDQVLHEDGPGSPKPAGFGS